MRLEQLRYFLLTAQTGSMRIAADQLYISQPTLSNGIKQLERELGYDLFIRSYNGVTLTTEGKRVLPIVVRAVNELSALPRLTSSENHSSKQELAGHLNILTVHSQNLQAIPNIIKYFRLHHPQISFHIFEQGSSEVIDGVVYEDYDLGLLSLHERQLNSLQLPGDIVIQKFNEEQAYIRVRDDSILAKEKEVSIDKLLTFPLIIPNSSLNDKITISKFFGDETPQNIILETNNNTLLDDCFKNNDCAIPYYLFLSDPNEHLSTPSKLIPITNIFTSFYAIYNKHTSQKRLIELFLQALKEQYHFCE